MFRISYWVSPILSGLVWLGMLLGLLLYWTVDTHDEIYSSMQDGQTIAYISDVGASRLKPLFIAGCVATTVLLDLSFAADRWLRHRGRLAPNTSRGEKVLSALCICAAVVGTVGLILLSVFDTAHYPHLHDAFLILFIAGYILSAVFVCWEYRLLQHHYKQQRLAMGGGGGGDMGSRAGAGIGSCGSPADQYGLLRASFWLKLCFIAVELVLAIAFLACNLTKHWNPGAVIEWSIAFIFSFYVFSFVVDLWPAGRVEVAWGSKTMQLAP